jgi:hypothetical protein
MLQSSTSSSACPIDVAGWLRASALWQEAHVAVEAAPEKKEHPGSRDDHTPASRAPSSLFVITRTFSLIIG